MEKQLLEEINRTREIMGLNQLLIEQGTRGKESDAVKGTEKQKTCPCNDGTSSPWCCGDGTGTMGYGPDYMQIKGGEVRDFDTPLYDDMVVFGLKPTEDMYLEELIKLLVDLEAKATKDISVWNALSDEEKKERSKEYCTKVYTKYKKNNPKSSETRKAQVFYDCDLDDRKNFRFGKIKEHFPVVQKKLEGYLKMTDEEFAALDNDDRSKFARTENERSEAYTEYNAEMQANDLEFVKGEKSNREKETILRDKEDIEISLQGDKLMKAFKKKLDKQSLRRWDNKDKAYNENGWVMSEEDKKGMFQLFRDYFAEWKDMKTNKKHVKRYKNNNIKLLRKFFSEINLRNVEGPPEKIVEIPTETEGTEGTESCAMELEVLQIPGIQDENFTPFINNSCELHQDLKQACADAASAVKLFMDENPGATVEIPNYAIWTSASRARNGGQAADWSFKELSDCRAKSVESYLSEVFTNIGVTLPTPVIDTNGQNKDGSSGPNPPAPFTMALGSGPKRDTTVKDGKTINNEANRDKYGATKPCKPTEGKFICPNYDEYKYCMVQLDMVGYPPLEEPDEEPGKPGFEEIVKIPSPTREWEMRFVPKKGRTKKWRKGFVWKPIKISFQRVKTSGGGRKKKRGSVNCPTFGSITGSRLLVGMAGGPVIDDVVKNGFASYNTNWVGN